MLDGRVETDPVKRKTIYCELEQIASDDAGTIIAFHRNYVDGIADNVKGLSRPLHC